MVKLNILFRVSGGRAYNKELGLGHVFRAMNLASQLKRHNIFFLVEDYGKATHLLKIHGYTKIIQLKKKQNLTSDIKITSSLINEKKIDILIVDKFDSCTKPYLKAINQLTKTVVIPDLKKMDYDADLVANGFVGYQNQVIMNRHGTKCLLGPSYQILNKQYEKNNFSKKKKFTILVTFGSFDEHHLVDMFCEELVKYLEKIRAKIILGPATVKSKKIKDLETKYLSNLKIITQTQNMKKEISEVEFGICAGGITTYEFAAMGVPFAIICQYKHQTQTARAWEKRKIASNLGYPNNFTRNRIRKLLSQIINRKLTPISKNKRIVDGLGAKRVAKEILAICQTLSYS